MKKLAVKIMVNKLQAQALLDLCQMNIRKIDHNMSDSDKNHLICTDFGATLDLSTVENDNSSVNNYAVICIFFVSQNRGKVSYKRKVEGGGVLDDKTSVTDFEKWTFFGAPMSNGKKNSHVFHNA